MASARAFWPRRCSPIRRCEPPLRWLLATDPPSLSPPPAVGRACSRRRLATALHHRHEPVAAIQHGRHGYVPALLRAIRARDIGDVYFCFIAWTTALRNNTSAALHELHSLPHTTFSEIVRSLDPVCAPESVDYAHGLHITPALTCRHDMSGLLDEAGVRRRHVEVLAHMLTLLKMRAEGPMPPLRADLEVLLRCAGAASDRYAAKRAWSMLNDAADPRLASTWTEFVRARFLTEPLYYQFNRSRVILLARDMHSEKNPLPMANLKAMDRIRHSLGVALREPWNRRATDIAVDERRQLRHRGGYRAYRNHWDRAIYHGNELTEEFICSSLVAFARSRSYYAMTKLILEPFYGITIQVDEDTNKVHVAGGLDFSPDSPIRPTLRLLDALVEAFCTMSRIDHAIKLLLFVSNRYALPIPASTWSNLLAWAYVCGSKPYTQYSKLVAPYNADSSGYKQVLYIYHRMTEPPHNVVPSFEDLNILIHSLLLSKAIMPAIDHIRDRAMPLFRAAVAEHQAALLDEILLQDVAPSPRATQRRLRAQVRMDQMRHMINLWFVDLLKQVSKFWAFRDGDMTRRVIPNLVREFADFFPSDVKYRTAQGYVSIKRPDAMWRWTYEHKHRTTLPQKLSGYRVSHLEGNTDPDFPYPQVRPIRILDCNPVPRPRMKVIPQAPQSKQRDDGYWRSITKELML
ncbi:hypothetical protein B0I35DRAFT_399318 [Stachybotrys elegans]|uniref:Uncharacterized protein n=1 Tax=Stachybotrys elegans TaxID=80388 RepID=A0A8K0WKR8_9HYPO|nr:hypothetical protein B0I35DRAFT_399318 [Stachybotrys elegans]